MADDGWLHIPHSRRHLRFRPVDSVVNPAIARKAVDCIVVPFPDGRRWRVGGKTAVYDVYLDMISGKLVCECRSRTMCSHIVATEHHRTTAKQQKEEA